VESEATIVIRLWSEKIVVFWIILSRTSASSRFITHNGTAIVMLSQIGTEEDHVLSDHTLVDYVFAICLQWMSLHMLLADAVGGANQTYIYSIQKEFVILYVY
jgi:hypothetical protein